MRIVKMNFKTEVYENHFLEKDKEYIISDQVLQKLLQVHQGCLIEEKKFLDFYVPLDLSKFQKGDSLLLFRSGGIGDVMFMLPLVSFLVRKYQAKITFGTSPQYIPILFGNSEILKTVTMPLLLDELKNNSFHLMFEGIIEKNNEMARSIHSVDLFLERAGINFEELSFEEKLPKLSIRDSEKKFFKERIIFDERKSIGIQIQASSPKRSYPAEKVIELIRKLVKDNCRVYLFGGKFQVDFAKYLENEFKKETGLVQNLVSPSSSVRDAIVLASFMDLIIAPDSSFVHIAGALGIPLIGLYGPFPSVLRLKYYTKAIGLDASTSCSPCFKHGQNPCFLGDSSPCLSLITPDLIMETVGYLLEGKLFENKECLFYESGNLVPSDL